MSFNRYNRFYKRAEYLLKQNYNLSDDDLKSDQAESFCNAYADLMERAHEADPLRYRGSDKKEIEDFTKGQELYKEYMPTDDLVDASVVDSDEFLQKLYDEFFNQPGALPGEGGEGGPVPGEGGTDPGEGGTDPGEGGQNPGGGETGGDNKPDPTPGNRGGIIGGLIGGGLLNNLDDFFNNLLNKFFNADNTTPVGVDQRNFSKRNGAC